MLDLVLKGLCFFGVGVNRCASPTTASCSHDACVHHYRLYLFGSIRLDSNLAVARLASEKDKWIVNGLELGRCLAQRF